MRRLPEIYRYRGETGFEEMTRPIRTSFRSDANLATLKAELDKMGAKVTEATLSDYMETAYATDDDIQRAELLVARGEVRLASAIEHLNRVVLETVRRKLTAGVRDQHRQFLDDATAFLNKDTKKIFTYLGDASKVAQYTRQDVQRHAGYMDMFRF